MAMSAAALHVGGLGLVFEPQASAIASLVLEASDGTLVMLDPNYRPEAVSSAAEYRERFDAVVARADVIKLSDEDLEQLDPGRPAPEAARRLLAIGPKVVLLTHGARGATVITAHAEPERERSHPRRPSSACRAH
jgi:fructokinase